MQLIHIEPQTSGEAGGITSSLRCEIAAWRKPEEDKPSFALETCCLLSAVFSATRLLGPLPPEETALTEQVQQCLHQMFWEYSIIISLHVSDSYFVASIYFLEQLMCYFI